MEMILKYQYETSFPVIFIEFYLHSLVGFLLSFLIRNIECSSINILHPGFIFQGQIADRKKCFCVLSFRKGKLRKINIFFPSVRFQKASFLKSYIVIREYKVMKQMNEKKYFFLRRLDGEQTPHQIYLKM